MLKLCGDLICKPLELIFKTCLPNSRFPLEWKKANVVPIYKKCDKQTIKTIVQFHYFLQINLDSDQEILASINYFQLIMKS